MIDKTGVYKITNNITGRFYIGSASKSFKNRWAYKYNKYLEKAFKKRGKENFTFEILLVCEPSECLYYEQIFIDKYCIFGENKNCYNICPVAGSSKGRKTTEEHKTKISEAHIGRVFTDEHRKKLSKAHLGKKYKPMTDVGKANISQAKLGKKHTEETRAKMSQSHIGKKPGPMTDETKQKMSEVRTGKKRGPFTDEHKKNLSKSKKKLSNDQVFKIRGMIAMNVSIKNISDMFSVSIRTIYTIKNGGIY